MLRIQTDKTCIKSMEMKMKKNEIQVAVPHVRKDVLNASSVVLCLLFSPGEMKKYYCKNKSLPETIF